MSGAQNHAGENNYIMDSCSRLRSNWIGGGDALDALWMHC